MITKQDATKLCSYIMGWNVCFQHPIKYLQEFSNNLQGDLIAKTFG